MPLCVRDLAFVAVGIALTLGLSEHPSFAGDCPSCGKGGAPNDDAEDRHLGPAEMPTRLYGRWKVSLCLFVKCGDPGHTYLRYENCETGEIHTVGRYQKGHGGTKNPETGEWVCPPAHLSGLMWDLDVRREGQIRRGEVKVMSCYVNDPIVFKGQNGGFGHGGCRNNCVTHVRDGWHHFTGEYYETGMLVESPRELLKQVAKRHPEILGNNTSPWLLFPYPSPAGLVPVVK